MIKNKKRLILILLIVLVVTFIIIYNAFMKVRRSNNIFAIESEKIYEENKDNLFSLDEIILFSNAEFEDLSPEQNLQDISIHQYNDIAIKIKANNENGINEANTINELYIDNIKIESNKEGIGEKKFNYKRYLDFAKYRDIENNQDRIDFKVLHSNEEQVEEEYDNPTFFTDCSNPITLSLIYKNVLEHCTATNAGSLAYDGSILKNANINVENLESKVSFDIHLKNNLNEEFICKVSFYINLDEYGNSLYNGKVNTKIDASGYKFLKITNNMKWE